MPSERPCPLIVRGTMDHSDTAFDKPDISPTRAMFGMFDVLVSTLSGGVHAAERSLVYHPSRGRPPADAALPGAESTVIDTSDGERVLAWGVPPAPGRPVILYFHGTGETVYSRPARFRNLAKAGYGILGLSYRGYASSTGSPSEDGLRRDAEAFYDHVRARHPGSPVVLWGYSLGSGVAVRLASERHVDGLVLEAPYTSIVEVGSRWFPYLPVRHLMTNQFRSDERIGRVTAPLLVLHGKQDAVVPVEFGKRLFALANEPKRIELIDQGDHLNLDRHGATRQVIDFISTVAPIRKVKRDAPAAAPITTIRITDVNAEHGAWRALHPRKTTITAELPAAELESLDEPLFKPGY